MSAIRDFEKHTPELKKKGQGKSVLGFDQYSVPETNEMVGNLDTFNSQGDNIIS